MGFSDFFLDFRLRRTF